MGVSPPNPRARNAAPRFFGATERGGANFWRMPQLPAPIFSATDERYGSQKYLAGRHRTRWGGLFLPALEVRLVCRNKWAWQNKGFNV